MRAAIGETCAQAMRDLGYLGAGTIEFLYEDGNFYFIEMNTRIQVEHPVTEMITGIDLVNEQIRIAAGATLGIRQQDIVLSGHAIECRVNAEHPATFRPSPGASSISIRRAVWACASIQPCSRATPSRRTTISLAAKLIVHGRTRNECMMRLKRALDEFVVDGIDTTLPLFRDLVRNQDIQNGDYDIHWLEKYLKAKAEDQA